MMDLSSAQSVWNILVLVKTLSGHSYEFQQPCEGGWEEQGMMRPTKNQFCCCCWWNLKGKRCKNQWAHEYKQYKNNNFNFIGAFIMQVVKQLFVYTHRVWRFLFSMWKETKGWKITVSWAVHLMLTHCRKLSVKNSLKRICCQSAFQTSLYKCMLDKRQSSEALISGKPGWNFTSDILKNPSLVILILIYTVTTRWLGLKTQNSYPLVTRVLY